MSRVSAVVLLLASLLVQCSAGKITGDMYVFAQSWQPEFCHGQTNFTGCSPSQPFWNTSFTLHGLWPQYSTGEPYPQFCTEEAFDTTVPTTIGMDTMTKYWPNAHYAVTDPAYDDFWIHEWTKHGTCSGLDQLTYFQTTIDLLKRFGTPAIVTKNVGGKVSAKLLRVAYGGASHVALQCDDGVRLNGAFTCWSETNGLPTKQVECTPDVQAEDTCTSDMLEVIAF